MPTFLRKVMLMLIMFAGALLLFVGALGLLNPGFKNEVPAAPVWALLGLAMMVGAKVADRPPPPKPPS